MLPIRLAAISWIDRAWPITFAVGAAALLMVLYLWEPAASGLFPPCPFHAMTGLHCPGCGSLRATHQLLRGEVWAAFRLNPLMVLALPFLAYAMVSSLWQPLRIGRVERLTSRAIWPLAILVIVIVYWVLRNLPFEPFSWLAPHAL